MVLIRPYEERDHDSVVACIAELQDYEHEIDSYTLPGKVVAAPYFTDLLKKCRDQQGAIYIAEVAGNVAGFISMFAERSNNRLISLQNYVYISDIFVKDNHRGEGIAKMLLAQAETYTREIGYTVIQLSSLVDNAVALSLYQKLGYEERRILFSKELTQESPKDNPKELRTLADMLDAPLNTHH